MALPIVGGDHDTWGEKLNSHLQEMQGDITTTAQNASSAKTDAANAASTANTAISTANNASAQADQAVTTANQALAAASDESIAALVDDPNSAVSGALAVGQPGGIAPLDLDGDIADAMGQKALVLDKADATVAGYIDDPESQTRVAVTGQVDTGIDNAVTEGRIIGSELGDADDTGYVRAWVDLDGRVALGVRSDGSVRIPQLTSDSYRSTYDEALHSIVSGPDIVFIGDSLTASGAIPATVQSLTGRACREYAVGGENVVAIAARQGAWPFLLEPVGGTIPGTGSVDVTFSWDDYGGTAGWPLLQGSGVPDGDQKAWGWLAGVYGELYLRVKDSAVAYPTHGDGDIYAFRRAVDGSAVNVNKPTPFYYEYGESRRSDIQVIWQGQNGPDDDTTFAAFKAEVQHVDALDKRFLLATGTGMDHTGWTTLERRMANEYGRRYINIRRYLIDHALDDLGLTPTTQDESDIAIGRVPTSLRTDNVHHTTEAQEAIAQYLIVPRLDEMGWL